MMKIIIKYKNNKFRKFNKKWNNKMKNLKRTSVKMSNYNHNKIKLNKKILKININKLTMRT